MVHLLKSASHPNLINLVATQSHAEIYHLYYEYAPLKL
jgi:hypothetical protein